MTVNFCVLYSSQKRDRDQYIIFFNICESYRVLLYKPLNLATLYIARSFILYLLQKHTYDQPNVDTYFCSAKTIPFFLEKFYTYNKYYVTMIRQVFVYEAKENLHIHFSIRLYKLDGLRPVLFYTKKTRCSLLCVSLTHSSTWKRSNSAISLGIIFATNDKTSKSCRNT